MYVPGAYRSSFSASSSLIGMVRDRSATISFVLGRVQVGHVHAVFVRLGEQPRSGKTCAGGNMLPDGAQILHQPQR